MNARVDDVIFAEKISIFLLSPKNRTHWRHILDIGKKIGMENLVTEWKRSKKLDKSLGIDSLYDMIVKKWVKDNVVYTRDIIRESVYIECGSMISVDFIFRLSPIEKLSVSDFICGEFWFKTDNARVVINKFITRKMLKILNPIIKNK